MTVLMAASYGGYKGVVEVLLSNGADLDAKNEVCSFSHFWFFFLYILIFSIERNSFDVCFSPWPLRTG